MRGKIQELFDPVVARTGIAGSAVRIGGNAALVGRASRGIVMLQIVVGRRALTLDRPSVWRGGPL